MSALHAAAEACFGVGVAVVVLTALGSLRVRSAQDRLHFLTPATALGNPLVGVGLGIENGWSLTTAQIALTCLLIAVTGPVLSSAALKVASQREGTVSRKSPE